MDVVDEVTQFQHLDAVPNITEYYLIPLLEALITAFPSLVPTSLSDPFICKPGVKAAARVSSR